MSPSLIAPVGQTPWQVPHATQLSEITYAIVLIKKINDVLLIENSSKRSAKVLHFFELHKVLPFFLPQ